VGSHRVLLDCEAGSGEHLAQVRNLIHADGLVIGVENFTHVTNGQFDFAVVAFIRLTKCTRQMDNVFPLKVVVGWMSHNLLESGPLVVVYVNPIDFM
jgi:hypothetical protein